MRLIDVFWYAPIFILSAGFFFEEKFRGKSVDFPGRTAIVVIAGLVAMVPPVLSAYDYFFPGRPIQTGSPREPQIQNSNQQSDTHRELQQERAAREQLAAELAQEKKKNITNVTAPEKPDTDQQRVEQLKDMGVSLIDNVFRLMMDEISKKRQ